MRDAIFAIRIDHNGAAAGFRVFDGGADVLENDLAEWAAGHVLVGVSTDRAFNSEARDASTQAMQTQSGWLDADLTFFIGTYGTENFTAGPLRTRQTVQTVIVPRWHIR